MRSWIVISMLMSCRPVSVAPAAVSAPVNDWCVVPQTEPTFDDSPSDEIKMPFEISAAAALKQAKDAQLFKKWAAQTPKDFVTIDRIGCPTKCDRTKHDCGYVLRVANHSVTTMANSVGCLYVDAIDGTVSDCDRWPRGSATPIAP